MFNATVAGVEPSDNFTLSPTLTVPQVRFFA
jgi:hypothetical protein